MLDSGDVNVTASATGRLADLVEIHGSQSQLSNAANQQVDRKAARPTFLQRLPEVNKELWLILSMLAIAAVLNFLVTGHRVILSLYALPTMFSAYFYGRRHAVLTAIASVGLVGVLAYTRPALFNEVAMGFAASAWFDIVAWGGILVLIAAAMGTLHERHQGRLLELRQTYHGLLLLLRQFISKDQQTESHCYRVAVYAAKIGAYLGLGPERIEDVRAASLLHDIGKVGVTRQLLQKAARLSAEERAREQGLAEAVVESAAGPLQRIIPIVLAHVDKLDVSGNEPARHAHLPIEARIIAVADVYDSLTSDHPCRKAMSPFEAKGIIVRCSGTEFDPEIVEAFQKAFKNGDLEVREVAA